MMLSDDKISHLSHVALKELLAKNLIILNTDESAVRKEIKRCIVKELKIASEIDEVVRKKLASLSRKLVEGSPEWDVMYKKYFAEEELRRGRR